MAKHWIDEYAEKLYVSLAKRGKEVYVFNGGLSVSGLQHIGRLRGEILYGEVLRRILEEKGLKIKQYITLYVVDEWKGKKGQLSVFQDPDSARKYTGWPLTRVPDPYGCHKNWVEHFWEDFGPYIKEFTDGAIEPVLTSELYRDKLREFAGKTLDLRERVREVINRYRGRKKLPENWIPFQPICRNCGRLSTTEALEIVENHKIKYRCHGCGYTGVADLSEGKLSWRIEWVGVWWALGVDFEPYGKDHAVPGGSRDSCNDLARSIYGFEPPEGFPYEWVTFRRGREEADMTSSGFIGVTPREWLEVAHPHIYRFLVLKTPPMKKITIDMASIPRYYDQYLRAERVYYGVEKVANEDEAVLLARSYELSYPRGSPPKYMPEQVPYAHLAILSQVVPRHLWNTDGIKRLKRSGHLPDNPSEFGVKRILETIEKAWNWVQKYAPSYMRVRLLPEPSNEIVESLPPLHREILAEMGRKLEELDKWDEDSIKNAMIQATLNLSNKERREVYHSFYRLFLGTHSGPRAAPLLALLGRERALRYFEKIPEYRRK